MTGFHFRLYELYQRKIRVQKSITHCEKNSRKSKRRSCTAILLVFSAISSFRKSDTFQSQKVVRKVSVFLNWKYYTLLNNNSCKNVYIVSKWQLGFERLSFAFVFARSNITCENIIKSEEAHFHLYICFRRKRKIIRIKRQTVSCSAFLSRDP